MIFRGPGGTALLSHRLSRVERELSGVRFRLEGVSLLVDEAMISAAMGGDDTRVVLVASQIAAEVDKLETLIARTRVIRIELAR